MVQQVAYKCTFRPTIGNRGEYLFDVNARGEKSETNYRVTDSNHNYPTPIDEIHILAFNLNKKSSPHQL